MKRWNRLALLTGIEALYCRSIAEICSLLAYPTEASAASYINIKLFITWILWWRTVRIVWRLRGGRRRLSVEAVSITIMSSLVRTLVVKAGRINSVDRISSDIVK